MEGDGGDVDPEWDCGCRVWIVDANNVNSLLKEKKYFFNLIPQIRKCERERETIHMAPGPP